MIGLASPRQSIKTSLVLVLLGLITLAVLLIALLAVKTIFTAGENAERVGDVTLRDQAEEFMVNLITVTAERNDLQFKRARQNIKYLTDYAANLYSHPERFNTSAYWRAEDHMTIGKYGHSFSTDGDIGSTYLPSPIEMDESVSVILEKIAYLDFLFVPIFESHPNGILIYMATSDGIGRFYPRLDFSDFPGGEEPDVAVVLKELSFWKRLHQGTPTVLSF